MLLSGLIGLFILKTSFTWAYLSVHLCEDRLCPHGMHRCSVQIALFRFIGMQQLHGQSLVTVWQVCVPICTVCVWEHAPYMAVKLPVDNGTPVHSVWARAAFCMAVQIGTPL